MRRPTLLLGGAPITLLGVLLALALAGWISTPFGRSGIAAQAAAAAAAPLTPEAATTQASSGVTVLPPDALSPAVLTGSQPETVTAKLRADTGGTIVAGNVGLSFSPYALAEAGGDVTVHVEANPHAQAPGGPAQFSPNGTLADISVKNGDGQLVTTFAEPVRVLFKYNAADLAMARGNPNILTVAYVLDADSPDLANPLHFPIGTWLFSPTSFAQPDPASGTILVRTQAIGSIFSVMANPVGYVQTLRPKVALYSSFDPDTAQAFGTTPQFAYLQVVEPQIGSRLMVVNPDTGNYAYVNATEVGPSGPPPTTPATPQTEVRAA